MSYRSQKVKSEPALLPIAVRVNTDDMSTVAGVGAKSEIETGRAANPRQTDAHSQVSRAKTKSSVAKSKKSGSLSSKSQRSGSSTSVKLLARRAALEVESAALKTTQDIEQQMLNLQQQAKRHQIETEINKLEAEQQVLDAISEEDESEADHLGVPEGDELLPDESPPFQQDRLQKWVDEVTQHTDEKPAELAPDVQPMPDVQPDGSSQTKPKIPEPISAPMNPHAPVYPANPYPPAYHMNPHTPVFQSQTVTDQKICEVIQTLHMPRTEISAFNGDPIKYHTFIRAFENNVGRYAVDEHAKLARLLQYCTGKAHKVIESCAAMQYGGYERALRLLRERFGDRYTISAAWIGRVTDGPRVTNDGLQDFADELLNFRETLSAINGLAEVNQRVLVNIAERLPVYLQHRWKKQAAHIRATDVNPDIDDLVKFMQSAAKEVTDPVYGSLGITVKNRPIEQRKGFHGATNVKTEYVKTENVNTDKGADQNNNSRPCAACDQGCSSLFKCDAFKDMNPEQRLETARKARLCFNCLRRGHSSADCKADSTCTVKGCRKKHTKFLHTFMRPPQKTDSTEVSQQKQTEVPTATCTHVADMGHSRVVLPVVKVKVTAQGTQQSTEAYALLDNGSTNTFCTEELLTKLNSSGQSADMQLTTLEKEGNKVKTTVHDLEVSDVQGNHTVPVRVYARPSIPVSTDCVVREDDLRSWSHLRDTEIPRLPQNGKIQMLIGQDCPEVLMPLEVRAAENPDDTATPFATRTLFGWTVCGPMKGISTAAVVNFVSLERQVEQFWQLEGSQLSTDRGLSVEDKRALKLMEESIQKDDGHYTVAIPLRDDHALPNNRVYAEKRLAQLAKKLDNNPELKEEYKLTMETLIARSYAEKVPTDDQPSKQAEWYIPHHAVIHPKKKKLRVVFDCAARFQDVALNDKVLQGPDLTNRLLGILMRFREHPIAISADIEAMFHQVRVAEEHRDYLRFLWWPEGDTDKPAEMYRMTVHLFGGTWSPSVCTFALRQTARDAQGQGFDPDVIEAVERDFYVDDYLKSVKTVTEAKKMVTDVPKLLAQGGFRLHKWISNNREVLEAIPEGERAVGLQDLNFQALPVERTLGVLWDVNADRFTYTFRTANRPATRRGLLGTVCSIYDPMGFITPFTIRGKKLLQDLTREKVAWDEPLSGQTQEKWQAWLKELTDIGDIAIDRCLQPDEIGPIDKAELHHFSDASMQAYGAASYLRLISNEGKVTSHLLFTRARIAPLKQLSIPRLELAGAVLSAQQDQMLRRELSIPITASYFYTDSTIVLAYIRNKKKRFHTFVANRLAAIHASTTVDQWQHVPSESNPADAITRGLSIHELAHNPQWSHGPDFLLSSSIRANAQPSVPDIDDDPEVKQQQSITACSTIVDVTDDLLEKYSSWPKLKRVVAWLLRYCKNLLSRVKKQQPVTGQLSVQEVTAAEEAVIRLIQKKEYKEEILSLQSPAGKVKKSSKIYSLDSALTDQGILVCRVRTPQMTPLVILPKNHHVSTLIVRHHHETLGHIGREFTVNEIRHKYWIVGLRTLVRQVLSSCRVCRRLFSAPMTQRMADLPAERLASDSPPFTNVGVDCFGPFTTKCGRKQHKRYGCIFTCLTSRAIHLEVLDSMDTFSFINALQRFISRRGKPRKIVSDNGTNFVGAEAELRKSLAEWNQQAIDNFLLQQHIQWQFNPPNASHMGGVWERMIRSVRRVLSAVVGQQTLNDDSLNTLMCLAENTVNSRPLTTVPSDVDDLSPLTPNHLLLMRPTQLLPPGLFEKRDCHARKRWRQIQYLADIFWSRWSKEYLPLVQLRTKWHERQNNLAVDDIVLVVDSNAPRNRWQLGRVTEALPGADGLVRSARIQTASGATLLRPVTKLCFLEGHKQDATL